MALDTRDAFIGDAFPPYPSAVLIKAVDSPTMLRVILRQTNAVVFGNVREIIRRANGGREKDSIAPNDGARVSEAGDRGFPPYVDRLFGVPCRGERAGIRDARSLRAAERRPVLRLRN